MAEHIPGSRIYRDPRWGLECRGPMQHPIGNFAWLDDPFRWQELDLPITQPQCFNVYVPSEQAEAPLLPGLRHALSQRTMVAEPRRRPFEARYRIDEDKSDGDREKTAQFMVDQFYQGTSRAIRVVMAQGIRSADCLRLFHISDGRAGIAGGCALYVGNNIWGIYNVIVDEEARSAGRGRALIEEMLAMGHSSGRLIQLQCNPSLVDWYRSIGFETHSYLHIYCF